MNLIVCSMHLALPQLAPVRHQVEGDTWSGRRSEDSGAGEEADLLNVQNFTKPQFQVKMNLRQKEHNLVKIKIVTNCRNF